MALVHYEPWNLLARLFEGIKGKAALAACLSLGTAAGIAQPASGTGDEGITRYSATTTNLDPEGVSLRFDVLRWSDDDAAGAVVAALESEDIQAAIEDVPTVGYIWPEGSPVGYSIKYARRDTADSGERATFVTSKPLGSYDFGGWTVRGDTPADELAYSVIELDVSDSGNGSGLASLATPVVIDAEAETVSLNRDDGSLELFVGVHRIESGYQ